MKTQAKHTPGPWIAQKEIVCYKDEDGFFQPLPETEANAHLIATAPELLEACKMGLLALKSSLEKYPLKTDSENALEKAIAKASA